MSDQEVDMNINYKRTVYCDAVHDSEYVVIIKLRIHDKKTNIIEIKTRGGMVRSKMLRRYIS